MHYSLSLNLELYIIPIRNQELYMGNYKSNRKKGFSLLELSVVLAISGIMLSAVLVVSSAQVSVNNIQTTQDKLDRIQQAITVYYAANGFLPCPAGGTYAATNSNFGKEQASPSSHAGANNSLALTSAVTCSNVIYSYKGALGLGTPEIYIGVVPTRTLGLPDSYMFDAWGNRLTYVVSSYCIARLNWSTFTDTAYYNKYKCSSNGLLTGLLTALNLTDGATIDIRDNTGTWMASDPYVAYVLISHGKNGVGAWNKSGTRITGAASNTTSEKANANLSSAGAALASNSTSLTTTYYDMKVNDGSGAGANYYDDIIRWKTAPQLDYDASH